MTRMIATGGRAPRIAAIAALGAALAQGAAAQQAGITPLPDIPGQNRAQSDMSASIDVVCPGLAGIDASTPLTGAPRELFGACSGMANSAAVLLTEANGGVIPQEVQDYLDATGLTFEQVAAGAFDIDSFAAHSGIVQQIAGEEFQSGQAQIAEIRNTAAAAIGARMSALRAGATGFSVAGLGAGGIEPAAFAGGASVRAGQAGGGELSEAFLGRFGGFASGRGTFGSKDATGRADGYDFTAPGFTVGMDYRLSDTLVIGGAFSYDRVNYDFDSSLSTASGQELDTDSYLFSIYGTAALSDRLFLEGIVSAGFANHDSTRRMVIPGLSEVDGFTSDSQRARADYDSMQFGFALGGGYDIPLGGATITPLAQVEYIHADIDGTTESGAGGLDLRFSDQEIDSFTSQLGMQAAYPLSTGFGIVQPYARGEWFHEFLADNDGALVTYANDVTQSDTTGQPFSSFVITTEAVDRNYGRLTGGVTVTLPNGIVGFVEGSATVGLANFDIFTIGGGLRVTF